MTKLSYSNKMFTDPAIDTIVDYIKKSIEFQENTRNRVITECEIECASIYENHVVVRSDCEGWAENEYVLYTIPSSVKLDSNKLVGMTEADAWDLCYKMAKVQPLFDYIDRVEAGERMDNHYWYLNRVMDLGYDRTREIMADVAGIAWMDCFDAFNNVCTKAERAYFDTVYNSGYSMLEYKITSCSKDRIVCTRKYEAVIEPERPLVIDVDGIYLISSLLGTPAKKERRIEEVIFE